MTAGKTRRETQAGKKSQLRSEQGLYSRDGDRLGSPGSRSTAHRRSQWLCQELSEGSSAFSTEGSAVQQGPSSKTQQLF